MRRAIVLFSGGLDSTLAVRIMQEQGFLVEALHVRTPFDCCRVPAARQAAELGVGLTVVSVADDYVEIVRRPRFGYGRAVNPCVDCRIYLCRMAGRMMDQTGACAVVTGEVLGQRAGSQRRRHLETIEVHAGLEGRLLRPLSARLLAPTVPEREGLVDREKLYAFSGRSRKPLIELARRLGVTRIPGPSTGCALAEPGFAPRVRDLVELDPQATLADFELLNYGRHVRLDERAKVVVGRNARENAAIRALYERHATPRWALLEPDGFPGPSALVAGRIDEAAVRSAAGLVLRYAKARQAPTATVSVLHDGTRRLSVLPGV